MFKFLKDKLKSAISKISEGVEKEGKAEEKVVEKPAEEKGFFAKIKEKFSGKEETQSVEKSAEVKREPAEEKIAEAVEYKEEPKPELKEGIKPIAEHKKEERHMVQHKEAKKEETKHLPKIKEEKSEHKHEIKKDEIISPKAEVKEEIKGVEIKPKTIEEPEKKGFFAKLTEKIITTKINGEQFEKLFWELELALMENNVAMEVIGKIKNDLKEQLVEKPIRRTRVEETIILTLKNSIEDLFQNKPVDLLNEV